MQAGRGWNYFQGGRWMMMVMSFCSMVLAPGGLLMLGGVAVDSVPGQSLGNGQGCDSSGKDSGGFSFPVDQHVELLGCAWLGWMQGCWMGVLGLFSPRGCGCQR